ncbi:MAG: aspartate ammonia-lyase [Candidatus Micrarchaeota archaeon]
MRTEEDFIGKVQVPQDAYYGSFTARALLHFRLSGMKVHKELTYAVALIKKCAALANAELGTLDPKVAGAIARAASEVAAGKFDGEFMLDSFQAGAGTPLHMNVNEVVANRAEELLGGNKGDYRLVHPNNHVNMSQSSNDVVPTAIRVAAIQLSEPVISEGKLLQKALLEKAREHRQSAKTGRTHLQDAVPMTYGQTFSAWAAAVERDLAAIEAALGPVKELGIGGTATGSGINTHPAFRKTVVELLRKESGLDLRMAKDPVQMTQDMNDFTALSADFRRYAVTLGRIASDIRLLSSGPRGGIAEIVLPEVEPGSSIMPGKINPSVPEAVNMACYQVMANDQAVLLGAQSGQLELNFCTPLIAHNLLQSEKLLANCTAMFRQCIEGTRVDEGRSKGTLDGTFAYATALNPYLGYKEVSKLVREALADGVTLKEVILKKRIMSESDLEKVLSGATGPSEVDKGIKERAGRKKD